jgi:hypothetical protein
VAAAAALGGGVRALLCGFVFAALMHGATYYVTVSGLGGEPDYEQRFAMWAKDLEGAAAKTSDAKVETLKNATKAALRSTLERIAKDAKAEDALVLTLIGHGTFDGADYKFNLSGPDIGGVELATLLDRFPGRQLVANLTSASGGALDVLRKQNRVVITATKSGTEKNATIFARYWVEALKDASADTDKNESISALEAFRYADQKTAAYYETQKRLATEHALLEDTGKAEGVRAPSPENGQGLLASSFSVIRLGSAAAVAASPEKRGLQAKKEQLEQAIDKLKYEKAAMPTAEYRKQLSALLLELAKTQEALEK